MRANIRKLVARLDGAFPLPEPVYEFGARAVPGQETRAIRSLAVRHWSRHESQGVEEWLTLLLPPILLAPAYRRFTRLSAWRRRRPRT